MAATRELKVTITGDASSLQKALGNANKQAQGFGVAVRRASLIAGAALGGGLVLAARAGFNELAEAQKVAAQTGAVLESTGGAANVTAKHVDSLASSLSRMSGVDDETIASGENLLLTFTGIRNEVGKGNDIFDQATVAITDLSVALGQDMKSSAIQVGKALNDPIKGMTALRRVGVSFTQAQVDQVKEMVKTGHAMDAQKLILRELNKEFGGSAKAAGDTLPGQLNKARNAFEEMAANVTVMLIPALTTLATITAKVSEFFQEHKTTAKVLAVALAALSGVLLAVGVSTKVYAAAQAIAKAATVAWTAVQWALNAALTANPIGLVVVAIGALVTGLVLAYKNSETFRRIVQAAFDAVKAAATAVLNFFRDNWKVIAAIILAPFAPVAAAAVGLFMIRDHIVDAANAILNFFRSNWRTIATIISGPFAPLVALATNAFGIRSALIGAFGAIVEGVREKVGALVSLITSLPGRITAALGNLSKLLYNAGVAIIQGLINGITDKLGDLWRLVGGIGGKIASLKGPIEDDRRLLRPQGQAIIEGLVAGIQDRLPDLARTVAGIAPALQMGIQQNVGVIDWFPGLKDVDQGALAKAFGMPDVTGTTEALGEVGASINEGTASIDRFSSAMTALPSAASQAFGDLERIIATSIKTLPEILAPVETAVRLLADAIHLIGSNAYYTRNALRDTVDEILKLAAQIGGIRIPGRQFGGSVTGGRAYVVGERGPELFIPNVSGAIAPAVTAGAKIGVLGTTIIQLVFNGTTVGTSREFEDIVRRALYDVSRRNPGTGLALT